MPLSDDSKKLEKSLGEEAAAVIAHVLERADGQFKKDLATKADVQATKADVQAAKADLLLEIAKTKNDILRWMIGCFIAQTALLVAVLAFLK